MKILSDKNISLKAKGMYFTIGYMKENNIPVSLKAIKETVSDGQTAVSSAMKELIEANYLERTVIREGNLIRYYEYKLK
jgi:CTP-dependent riboflavin kinase